MSSPLVRLRVLSRSGQLLQEASFRPALRDLSWDALELVGSTEDGRRISVVIAASLLERVPAGPDSGELAVAARDAEERLISSVLARAQVGSE